MRNFIAFLSLTLISSLSFAQAPDTIWTRVYQGSESYEVQQTAGGGFIIVGYYRITASNRDAILIRTDSDGDVIWTRTFGGDSIEVGYSVHQTTDGGFIVAGYTRSFGAGGMDYYLVKTDAAGNAEWTKTYGGTGDDIAKSVRQTSDGGYIIVGQSETGINLEDTYLVKTDSAGDTLWTRRLSVDNRNYAECVRQTYDGGYVVAGWCEPLAFPRDVFLIKVDSSGNQLWAMLYDAGSDDHAYCVEPTPDGGYVIAGECHNASNGSDDALLIKTAANGTYSWISSLGGSHAQYGYSVALSSDGGYVIAGQGSNQGVLSDDAMLIKVDSAGTQLWYHRWGGADSQRIKCVSATADEGYITSGRTTGANRMFVTRFQGAMPLPGLEITPHNPPVQIPASGGSFGFDLSVANPRHRAVTLDVWSEVLVIDNFYYGPLLLRQGITVPGGASLSRALIQRIPWNAPSGEYVYLAKTGVFPDGSIDIDSFHFTKLSGGECASNTADNWEVSGWVNLPAEDKQSQQSMCIVNLSASPNPFNAEIDVRFELRDASRIKLTVYDISGREAAGLADGFYSAGIQQAVWDASAMASGVYFARLQAGDLVQVKKLLLLK